MNGRHVRTIRGDGFEEFRKRTPRRVAPKDRKRPGVPEITLPNNSNTNCGDNAEPTFLFIGVARSGSYYLYEALKRHPDVGVSSYKEPHYFDREYQKGLLWYKKWFPPRKQNLKEVGEFTVTYIFHPLAPYLIRRDFPKIRLIVSLRDPVMRAYSHWALFKYGNRWRSAKQERKDFRTCVMEEPRRLNDTMFNSSYVARGFYADQMARLFHLFDREKILVLRYEDLKEDPSIWLDSVSGFLGVDRARFAPQVPAIRVNQRSKEATGPDPETERYLRDLYRPSNQALYELLGRDMGWPE